VPLVPRRPSAAPVRHGGDFSLLSARELRRRTYCGCAVVRR
jgi:hypothetical protein